MRRAAALLLGLGALAFAGCNDGFEKIDPTTFYVYDDDGDGVDYKMSFKACQSVGKVVDKVRTLPGGDGSALVTCR